MSKLLALSTVFLIATGSAEVLTLHLQDADGHVHSSSELREHRATVFVFLATDCPNSNRYAPELGRLYSDYQRRRVAFYGVYSNPSETAANVRRHDADFRIPFPALLDPQQSLARRTGARVTPEVAVVSPTGEEVYHGRIDDRFADFGKTRLQVDKSDLRAALDQILAGKPVSNSKVPSLGCAIPAVNTGVNE